jgi:DNA-binding GntR family transcriptional regulator
MQGAVGDGDLNVFYPNNLRFHEAIVQFCGNERLAQECVAIHREMHLFRRRTLDLPGRMAASNEEHRAILARLVDHDARGAAVELENHVLTSREVLFGPLGSYPKRGS